MKALIYRAYGARDVMKIETIPDPAPPRRGEVRVRVLAASINPVDGKVRRGELKLIAGGRFPKRPGLDFSGVVEALGDGVKEVSIGDAVYGGAPSMSEGAFVERLVTRANAIARKPASLDPAIAAGVPIVACAALQALRDIVKVKPGQSILINGCTGGVGLFALQFAKAAGAKVTGVCSASSTELARDFGADVVIPYQTNTAMGGPKYRAILELSGRLSFNAARTMLEDGGAYLDFSPSPSGLIANAIANPFRARKHLSVLSAAKSHDLAQIAAQLDRGELRPPPTEVFPLQKFSEAFAKAEGGGVRGKIVVRIAADF